MRIELDILAGSLRAVFQFILILHYLNEAMKFFYYKNKTYTVHALLFQSGLNQDKYQMHHGHARVRSVCIFSNFKFSEWMVSIFNGWRKKYMQISRLKWADDHWYIWNSFPTLFQPQYDLPCDISESLFKYSSTWNFSTSSFYDGTLLLNGGIRQGALKWSLPTFW